jgi:protein-S-isoprenylcysteine O-methyltransferase Ste14
MKNLRMRALLGIGKFSLTLALLLFIPAATLRFWQGWIYWILFSGSVLAITLYFLRYDPTLIERRLVAGPRAEERINQKLIQVVAAILFVALIMVPAGDYRFHGSAVPAPVALVADALCVLALVIIFFVFSANSYAAATIKVEAAQPVISSGPYHSVRHPMYAGGVLLIVATPLALGSVRGLLVTILLLGGIIARLLDEERYLSANLPGYADYCRKVRYRLVPLVW